MIYSDLLEAVEALTEPSRHIDSFVQKALYPNIYPNSIPHFTGNIADALSIKSHDVWMNLLGPTGGTYVCKLQDPNGIDAVGIGKSYECAIISAGLRLKYRE